MPEFFLNTEDTENTAYVKKSEATELRLSDV